MPRYKETLKQHVAKEGALSLPKLRRIAVSLLHGLEKLHSLGYIHRDLKPQNVMLDDEQKALLIDYGVAVRFEDKNKKHIKFEKRAASIVGTPTFLSQNAVQGMTVSRRDDLESMLYVLLQMHRCELPWQNYSDVKKECTFPEEALEEFKEARANLSDEAVAGFFPRQLRAAFRYVRALRFSEFPNYALLRDILADRAKQPKSDLLCVPSLPKGRRSKSICMKERSASAELGCARGSGRELKASEQTFVAEGGSQDEL